MDPTRYFEPFNLQSDSNGMHEIRTPVDQSVIGHISYTTMLGPRIVKSHEAFLEWRKVPAPRRGELIRLFGNQLRRYKEELGALVTLESGKILAEGLGEVQEMIDICDFAVGLSRQLYGLTMPSERPGHIMKETWLPLGVVAVISAFNFPVAVWAWNFALAIVCGNSVIWKPSEKTPYTAIACHKLFETVAKEFKAPEHLSRIVLGDSEAAQEIISHPLVKLISATGSTKMGKAISEQASKNLKKTLLELGGNNAMIVAPSADLDLATRAIVFSAVGTAGQRCTSLRRLIVHESIYDLLIPRLIKTYKTLPIGNPFDPKTLVGPLIDQRSYENAIRSLEQAKAQGGTIHGGTFHKLKGNYIHPALVEMPNQTAVVKEETFAPILYVMKYAELEAAIAMNNDVMQGLSSCIFTNDVRESEYFLLESDCGIANVNIGPSGAEIGGAFGGEKDTGGGRESGSDSWKSYMRRSTNTINYSRDLPLAQGIKFETDL
jgi:aldehyde dehydrogenase (NAD+)